MPRIMRMPKRKEVFMSRKLALALAMGLGGLWSTSAAATTAADTASEEAASADPSAYSTTIAVSATAAQDVQPTNGGGWEFAVTPYLWMSGTKADIDTPQGEEIEVDSSFIDILGDLKFAFMGAFEARNGRFVILNDLMYLSMGTSADGSIGPVPLEAEADMKLLSTTSLLGYRVVDQGPMFLDLMAGARITTIKADLELSGPLQTFERDSKKTTVGPVIASRVRFPLSDRWGVAVYGDLGGFGVGADLSWQLLGTVQYDISDHWRVSAGWRHFSAKQDKNDFEVDIDLDGPIIGFSYRF